MNSTVLIISAVFPPEPVVSAKLSSDIVNDLVAFGIHVTVLHPKPTRPFGFYFNREKRAGLNFQEVLLPSYTCPKSNVFGRLFESYSFGCKCRNYIQSHHLELACIYVNSWPLFSQAIIVKTASKYGIPCIMHVQDIYPESFINKMSSGLWAMLFQRALLPIDKYILSHADYIFAISANMKEYLVKTRKIDSTKISIIENWQNEDEFIAYHNKLQMKKENRPLTFMYLGNNGPIAGVEFLIHCFVKANIQGARLVIAGSGSRKVACMELAKTYSNVEIEFWDVPDGKVPEIHFHLMEHGGVGQVGVAAVDLAGSHDGQGRLAAQHGTHLHGGGVGAHEHALSDVEGVLHVAGGTVPATSEPIITL